MPNDTSAMRNRLLKVALVTFCFFGITGVSGYSKGAPDTTCNNMIPGHGASSTADLPSPYTVTPGSVTVGQGETMLVTLETTADELGFKGFLLQARSTENDEPVGNFKTTDYKYITCGKGFNNAVTHGSSSRKNKVLLEYTAPADYSGEVVFRGTFVQNYNAFWVNVTSEKVTVAKRSVVVTPAADPTTTATTTTTATSAAVTTESSSSAVSLSVDAISPENAGDFVINVVDAPGVDGGLPVVENDLVVVEDEGSSAPPTPPFVPSSSTSPPLSSSADSSPSSTLSEDVTDSPFSSDSDSSPADSTTERTPGRTPPKKRFGLLGRFKTTSQATPKATTATEADPVVTEEATPSEAIEILPPGVQSLQNAMQNIYLGCESNKGCYGFPAGCEKQGNCDMLVTYSKVSSGYEFEIMGTIGNTGYVAAGLSDDDKMGSDSVMACTSLNDGMDVLMGFNNGKTNEILSNSKYGLSDIKTANVDGRVYCSFVRQTLTEIKSINFNLEEDRFHLMLARGPLGDQLQYHDKRAVSSSTSSMAEFKALESSSEMNVTIHACLMIGAWVFAASCGILLARYYKQTWLSSKCCGIDQWFHFHRFFMILTWGLTIGGIVSIVLHLKAWSSIDITVNPHPLIGAISSGLCFIQPFMALCRCGPTHKRRPVFNWFHWFVGNSAHILGLTAIFFGLDLVKAPSWTWFVLIVFIAFHCIVHLILSIGQCVSDSKTDKSNNVFPMKDMNGSRSPLHPIEKREDAPGATFRKTMLALYMIITILITAILIVVIAVGEDILRKNNILFWENL